MIIIYVTLTAFVTNCTVTTTELVMNVIVIVLKLELWLLQHW